MSISPSCLLAPIADHIFAISSLPSLKDFIEKKYAQGTWMNQEDRAYYFDQGGIAL